MARDIPPAPPYRWRPEGTQWDAELAVGSILPWRHAAWRVIDIRPIPEVDWDERDRQWMEGRRIRPGRTLDVPCAVIVRPVAVTGNDPRARDYDVHLHVSPWHRLDVYPDEHYPVCAKCLEPMPCRERKVTEIAERAAKAADAHSVPGVCPACQEPITGRQRVMTFEENLLIPFGPPVTFHSGRRGCRDAARDYERRWADAAPGRKTTLSCRGHVWQHADGPECSEGAECAGIGREIRHDRWGTCPPSCLRCRDARARAESEVEARNAAGDWTTWRSA